MRKTLIIANWKMNLKGDDLDLWLQSFTGFIKTNTVSSSVILAPSLPYLAKVSAAAQDLKLSTAAQDISVYDKGAHTGETGGFQLKDFCTYCIVGHSERKEPVETVLKKRDNCLMAGIIPVVCFTDPEKVTKYYTDGCVLAWEDPQNISVNGVYRAKDPQAIIDSFSRMRRKLPDSALLIYGGSVNGQNIASLVKIHGLDGVLVGNASLDPQHFSAIVSSFEGF